VGAELGRRRALGIDPRNGCADRYEYERQALKRPRARGPPRGTERETTQRGRVGPGVRDPTCREAGVGRAALLLLEAVMTQRGAQDEPAAKPEPLVDVVPQGILPLHLAGGRTG